MLSVKNIFAICSCQTHHDTPLASSLVHKKAVEDDNKIIKEEGCLASKVAKLLHVFQTEGNSQ